tara:strand:+ start:2294 stop:2674 length:381 start_codon:yes stop_codon:yes gene_type:complete
MSEEEPIKLEPVDAFTTMFFQHLKTVDYNLIVNNFILLRNLLKQAIRDSHLNEAEISQVKSIEESWVSLNKGCSCTKNQRMKGIAEETSRFVLSQEGRKIFEKIKSSYEIKILRIEIPEPVIECEI